jgi:class 3 adenylate cyclase
VSGSERRPRLRPVPGFQKRSLDYPDEWTTFERGENRIVQLDVLSFGRTILEPGWHWAEHMGPTVGTPTCQFPHFMMVASGRMRIVMDDGTVHDVGPRDVVDIPPGHDGWVIGDEPMVIYDIAGIRGWGKPPSPGERMLTTLLFTDIVDSTPLAQRLGDVRWKELLGSYYITTRLTLDRFRGHQITTTGDGVLANFDSPARAIRCAEALIAAVADLQLQIRVGVHTGEVEVTAGDLRGLTVHIAARVMALAAPGEILVSDTSRQLASGSDLDFDDRGEHSLKGVAEPWRLFAVVS